METIIKDLKLPKEVTEIQEALPIPEPESGGLGGTDALPLGSNDLAPSVPQAAVPKGSMGLPVPGNAF